VKIPEDAIIPDAKLTRYLLVLRPRNDKSKFMAQAGFIVENSPDLVAALRQLTRLNNAGSIGFYMQMFVINILKPYDRAESLKNSLSPAKPA